MDVLVLSSLARIPMHGYEIKTELQYKHVRWWAKAEHGHLYAALTRLEAKKLIRAQKTPGADARGRRVFTITAAGRKHLNRSLIKLVDAEDETFFDIDLFLACSFCLDQSEVVELLGHRRELVKAQGQQAEEILERMSGRVPLAGRLIMEHRIDHFRRETTFLERVIEAVKAEPKWGPMLGEERIQDFVARTGVDLER